MRQCAGIVPVYPPNGEGWDIASGMLSARVICKDTPCIWKFFMDTHFASSDAMADRQNINAKPAYIAILRIRPTIIITPSFPLVAVESPKSNVIKSRQKSLESRKTFERFVSTLDV
jgi:hypothetical protein